MRKEGGCSHIEHSHIDESGQAHGNYHVGNAPAKDAPRFLFAAWDNAMLSERGVQIDDVWHNRGANDSYREEGALRPTQPGDNGMKAYLAPIWMGEECLNQVTERNHPNQGCDYRLQRAEPAAFQRQDQVGGDTCDERGVEQGKAKQEIDGNTGSQKLSEIGRHGC